VAAVLLGKKEIGKLKGALEWETEAEKKIRTRVKNSRKANGIKRKK